MELKGKNILITGAAKRIGRAIALAFAKKGACVVIHCHRSKKEAEALAKQIRSLRNGCQVRVYQADLLKVRSVKGLAIRVLKDVGVIDVLVNNASVFRATPFPMATERDWDDFLGIHVKAPFFLAQALAPQMKKRGWGRIINILDQGIFDPNPDYLPYAASKGGLMALTQGLAKALAPKILVAAVSPGLVLPPPGLSRAAQKRLAKAAKVKKWGKPEDVAKAVVALAEFGKRTGINIYV